MNIDFIKKKKIYFLVLGVCSFLLMLIVSSDASEGRNNVNYYWSKDVRDAVSFFSGLAVILGIIAAFAFVNSIFLSYLEKNGKVCPVCRMVYVKSAKKCFQCKNDITYAKSITEYWAESPVVKKGTPTTSANISYPAVRNNISNASREKFCPSCGQKMKGTDHFCPRCGKKM